MRHTLTWTDNGNGHLTATAGDVDYTLVRHWKRGHWVLNRFNRRTSTVFYGRRPIPSLNRAKAAAEFLQGVQ